MKIVSKAEIRRRLARALFTSGMLLLVNYCLFADESVIMRNGKTAILKDNGTWSYSEPKSGPAAGFRNVQWGSSMQSAISSEGRKPDYNEDNILMFETNVAGLSCSAFYIYVDDKLVRGRYSFDQKHSNSNDYIDDYKKILELLTAKYGKMLKPDQVWKDDLYKDNQTMWGFALSLGKMYYFGSWTTSDSEIELQLWGDNIEVFHVLDYTSVELGYLEKAKKEKEASDQL